MINLHNPQQRERTLFFLGILLTSTLAVVWLLRDYIGLIVLALIFSIVVRPLYNFLNLKLRIGSSISTILTIVVSFILLIMPMYVIASHLVQELIKITTEITVDEDGILLTLRENIRNLNRLLEYVPVLDLRITYSNVDSMIDEVGKSLRTSVLNSVVSIGTASVHYIAKTFLFLILTYFMIPSLSKLKAYILIVSPLHDDIDKIYIEKSVALIISLLKSIFIIALAQGVLGGIFLLIAGVPYVLTLTIVLIFASLLPFVGTNIVIIPIALGLMLQGNMAGAAIVLIGQLVFVTNVDNVLAASVISKDTSLHPALMLLAIIAGVSVFGFTGILFGPIIVILFLTSMEIYTKHYKY